MGILTEIKIKREKFLIFVVKIKCSVCGSENVSKNSTLKQRKKIYLISIVLLIKHFLLLSYKIRKYKLLLFWKLYASL